MSVAVKTLRQELQEIRDNRLIGEHTGLRLVMEKVRQVAPMNTPVLLSGETGVGKDLIAEALHRLSNRRHGPWIRVILSSPFHG